MVVGGAPSAEQVVQIAAAGGLTLSAADRAEIEVSAPGPSIGRVTGARFSFDKSHDE